ncbi:MAG: SUKH-4 family immunity protein [Cytophagales bacterium]|nr:SUKH-4 family immunity protein [Cytophagales bacterium]
MITPEAFKTAWQRVDDNLIRCTQGQVEGLGFRENTIHFLLVAGLPDDAAPFLSFSYLAEGRLRGVGEVFKVRESLSRYKAIGFDGNGCPICVDVGQGDLIVCLNHDHDFEAVFVNASVHQLAETLLAFLHFGEAVRAVNGVNTSYDEVFTDAQFNSLVERITVIDGEALQEGNFWQQALQTLLANRNFYQQERENKDR